ncbi:MAG: hypothetical protein HYY30_04965 [Chloroflexi bacterium]|nr:hypothetical protein [Chloroflexota bacterium]
MRFGTIRSAALIGILSLSLGLIAACTQAQPSTAPEEFFKGKTISWVVSTDAGSNTDMLGRAVAPYLEKEIGATVKIENTQSGEGENFVFTQSKPDGLTFLHNNADSMVFDDVLKAPGVLYEVDKFNFLANLSPGTKSFQVSPKLPYKTLDELRKAKGLKGGGTTAKGSLGVSDAVMTAILGLDAKVITGFTGKKALVLAVARGEIHFIMPSDAGAMRDAQDGNVVNMMVISKERSPAIPDVPTMFELGVKIPKELEGPYNFINFTGSAVALPPGVPQDRIDYLRKAFSKLSDNKDLQNDLVKLVGVARPFVSGKDLQQEMLTIKADKGLADQIDSILTKYTATQ